MEKYQANITLDGKMRGLSTGMRMTSLTPRHLLARLGQPLRDQAPVGKRRTATQTTGNFWQDKDSALNNEHV